LSKKKIDNRKNERDRERERETYLPKGLRREKGAINEGTNEEKRNKGLRDSN
jgi:hypothetical protein